VTSGEPDLTRELDEAEAIVMGRAESVVTEWGVDCTDGRGEHRVNFGEGKYGGEEEARAMIDRDQHNGIGAHNVLVRRTVTYSPWEEVPDDEAQRQQEPPAAEAGSREAQR
jgi:hypothetical protein